MKKRLLPVLAVLTGLFLFSASIVWAQAAPVAKTGQTTSYVTGDDGYYQKGVASPSPRFTDNGDGTVTDNLTGLMWAKNANIAGTTKTWVDAIAYANTLSLGTSCGSPRTDWRLPNRNELNSLSDVSNSPALPSGHPFVNVQVGGSNPSRYWSSTTSLGYYNTILDAYWGDMFVGLIIDNDKTNRYCVWPVRSDN